MKVKIITLVACMLTVTVFKAQTKSATTTSTAKTNPLVDMCELLKKENELLKKTLNIGEPIISKVYG